jgi:uncharacterized repeat protein (TIGR03803 family)
MRLIGFGKTAYIVAVFCIATAVVSQAQTFKTLFSFDGTDGGAANPLMQAADGNFYGTTQLGGSIDAGTLFRITPMGKLTTLHNFCSQPNCTDGAVAAAAALLQAPDGNFYGSTTAGGGDSGSGGIVFQFTPSGALTALYNFCAESLCDDGNSPEAVVFGHNGKLYGTTAFGGTGVSCMLFPADCGTFFELSSTGQLTTLYNFCSQTNCTDGASPANLLLATNGRFYDTAENGGNYNGNCDQFGCGTIFETTSTGEFSTLYSFCSVLNNSGFCADGEDPRNGMIQSTDGDFYGITLYGGTTNGGTIFKITPAGKLTTLYNFCSQTNCLDGELPNGGLIQGTDGNFYGTTFEGGANSNSDICPSSCGTAFQITPSGQLTTVYNFCSQSNCSDGANPTGSLMQSTNGTFYGVALQGGGSSSDCRFGCGTLFSLSVGLGPFVETNPGFGTVGQTIGILGNNLSSTTKVSFNGKQAPFKIASSTLIKAIVPTGATTGTVQVTTSSGKLSSNVPFQVLP